MRGDSGGARSTMQNQTRPETKRRAPRTMSRARPYREPDGVGHQIGHSDDANLPNSARRELVRTHDSRGDSAIADHDCAP